MGRALLGGDIHDGATITIDADGEELTVTWRRDEQGDGVAPEVVETAA